MEGRTLSWDGYRHSRSCGTPRRRGFDSSGFPRELVAAILASPALFAWRTLHLAAENLFPSTPPLGWTAATVPCRRESPRSRKYIADAAVL